MIRAPLSVGIAGFGIVGQKRFGLIKENSLFKVVSVSDVRFQDAEFREDASRLIADDEVSIHYHFSDLLKEDLDVVFVSLPNHLAPEATMGGLKKGCHVFCEKPPGRTVEDIRNVIKIENENPGLKLKYGFNHRYHGSVDEAKKIVDSGQFGEILNFRGIYGKSSIVPFSGGWRCERKYAGGGILLDQGIHMLDMLRFFHGDFDDIHSFVSNAYWQHDIEDNAFAILRDDRGVVASVSSSATQWQHRFRLEIALREGSLELSGILSGSKSYGEEKLKIIPRTKSSMKGSVQENILSYLEDNSWKNEIDEFADLILEDQPVENGKSEDALEVMKMVYRVYYADSEWRDKFQIPNPDA